MIKPLDEDLPTSHPRPWRKCGMYLRQDNATYVLAKDRETKLTASARTYPEAVSLLRAKIADHNEALLSYLRR